MLLQFIATAAHDPEYLETIYHGKLQTNWLKINRVSFGLHVTGVVLFVVGFVCRLGLLAWHVGLL